MKTSDCGLRHSTPRKRQALHKPTQNKELSPKLLHIVAEALGQVDSLHGQEEGLTGLLRAEILPQAGNISGEQQTSHSHEERIPRARKGTNAR